MRNPFYVILLLMASLCFSTASYAAFPAKRESSGAVITKRQSFDELINNTIEKYRLPVPPYGGDASEGSGVLSIVALLLGIGGVASIIAAFAVVAPELLIVAGLCGLGAIIMGAMGSRRRPLRGFGIAGFVLGIIDMSVLLAITIITLLILSLFEE